jgi:hypothetical protein
VDANQIFNRYSPWIKALVSKLGQEDKSRQELRDDEIRQILKLKELVLHGADPNAYITERIPIGDISHRYLRQSVLQHFQWMYDKICTDSRGDSTNSISAVKPSLQDPRHRLLGNVDKQKSTDVETVHSDQLGKEIKKLIELLSSEGARGREWREIGFLFKEITGFKSRYSSI